MNVLITGSSGFLGKAVVSTLNKYKYNLIFIGKKKLQKKNYIFCNLKNLKKFKSILEGLKLDVVINLAAEVNFLKKSKNMYNINAYCPHEIAKFCKKKKIHLIQASGTIVNGLKKTYSKKTKFNPVNDYGKSKLKGDNLIKSTKCKYTILRFGGIYGKGGPSHLGINNFIKLAIKNKKIIFNGNKNSLRNYIFVNDAANVILNCLKHKRYGIYYVGGEIITFKRMLESINKVLSKKKNLIFFDKNNKKIDNQVIKTDKIIKHTSFINSLKLIK